MKFLLLAAYLISIPCVAGVKARWLSVASILIEDGETSILFDAAWTRPQLSHWMGMSSFRSDKDLVAEVIRTQKISNLKAMFVTHTHFDHCVDAPVVARMTGAILYASKSMKNIASAYKDPRIKVEELKPVTVGDFKVSMFPRVHSEILGWFEFLPGVVPDEFDFNFYDYKVGESWIYLIEHPMGKILIDTSGDANIPVMPKDLVVDVVFQGVANRKSNQVLTDGYVRTLKPKKFVASHFDPFMFGFTPGPQSVLPNVDFPGLEAHFKQKAAATEFIIPEYGKSIQLF